MSISCVVLSLTVPYYFSLYYIDHKVIFCVRIIALFQYSLPYNYKFLVLVAGATATFLSFRFRNTKVILFAVFWVSRIRCYCREYCCTIYFIIATMTIFSSLTVLFCTKHYSTYTIFTTFVSKTVFYITNSS